jgi:hypothetical protein
VIALAGTVPELPTVQLIELGEPFNDGDWELQALKESAEVGSLPLDVLFPAASYE